MGANGTEGGWVLPEGLGRWEISCRARAACEVTVESPQPAQRTWPFTKSPDALHLGVLYYTYLGTNTSGDFSNCQVDKSGTSRYDRQNTCCTSTSSNRHYP